jgi:hypothetical protein
MEEQEFIEYEEDEIEDVTLKAAVMAQFSQAPWYCSSIAVHTVILLILLLLPVAHDQTNHRRIVITTEIVEEPIVEDIDEPDPDLETKDPEVTDPENLKLDEVIIKTTDIQISDHFETDDDMDTDTALGDPDNISDVDHEFIGTPSLMGVGNSGGKGGGGRFGFRTGGGRGDKVREGGGDRGTESSVNMALRWLAAHQESDGRWNCKKYGGGLKHGDDHAVTALALLAFLGAGNSSRFGKYRRNVKAASDWLMNEQKNGHIGTHRYTSGLTLMAMAETYGMSMDRKYRKSAQAAADWAVKSQCKTGAWDYKPNSDRSDTSVTGWWIMGIKSAKVSGLHIPSETYELALEYIKKATTKAGSVSYSSNGGAVKAGGGSPRMTAVGLTCLQFLGVDKKNERVKGCADSTSKINPQPEKFDFYLWYYQALGLFQMGVKSDYWKNFNESMKTSLLTTQVKVGTVQQNKGSWNPDTDKYGPSWGRVGQTAIGALMLEIYYRYKEVKQ